LIFIYFDFLNSHFFTKRLIFSYLTLWFVIKVFIVFTFWTRKIILDLWSAGIFWLDFVLKFICFFQAVFRIFLRSCWHFKFGEEFISDQITFGGWTRINWMKNIKLWNLQLTTLLGTRVLLRDQRIPISIRNWNRFHVIFVGEE
jgi:hypothetical protein